MSVVQLFSYIYSLFLCVYSSDVVTLVIIAKTWSPRDPRDSCEAWHWWLMFTGNALRVDVFLVSLSIIRLAWSLPALLVHHYPHCLFTTCIDCSRYDCVSQQELIWRTVEAVLISAFSTTVHSFLSFTLSLAIHLTPSALLPLCAYGSNNSVLQLSILYIFVINIPKQ